MASIIRYGAEGHWPASQEELFGRIEESIPLSETCHCYSKVRLRGRLQNGMDKATIATTAQQTERLYCRALLFNQDQDLCWRENEARKERLTAQANSIPAISVDSKENLWLIEAEVPNQAVDGDSMKSARLDLLGFVASGQFVFVEAKQGKNGDSLIHAVAEAMDYMCHLRATMPTDKIVKMERDSLADSMQYLQCESALPELTWPPKADAGAIVAILADEAWWDKKKQDELKTLVNEWPRMKKPKQPDQCGLGGVLTLWALQIDWENAHENRVATLIGQAVSPAPINP